MKNLEDLRVVDLRNELDRRGLDKAGVKAVLIERLKKAILAEGGNPNEFEVQSQSGSSNKTSEDEQKSSESEKITDSQDRKEPLGPVKTEPTTPQTKTISPKKGVEVKKTEKETSPTSKMGDKKTPDVAEDDDDDDEEEEESRHEATKRERKISHKEYDDDPLNLFVEDDDKLLDYEENDMEDQSNTDGKDRDDEANDMERSSSDSPSKQNSKEANKSEKSSAASDEIKDDKSQSASCSKNLWVSGLSSVTRAQDLKTLFSKHGKVLSAKIVTNAKTPGAKCFGFVTMSTLDDANKCITHLNHAKLQGREIQVEKAKGEQNTLKLASKVPQISPDMKDVKTRQPITINSSKDESFKGKTGGPNKSPMNEKGINKGKQMPQPGIGKKNLGGDEKKGAGRGKLSVKDRVVDRRPGAPKPRVKQVPFRARRSVLVAGNSIAGVVSEHRNLAAKYGIDFESQCWPDEDLTTILSNLSKVVRRDHQVIVIFGLTFEAWKYVSLLENQFEPRIVFPNPSFSLDTVASEMDKFIEFCKSKNPLMKVFLVVPFIQDMYAYNHSRVEKYSPKLLPNLENSPSFNKDAMAESARIVYGKFSKLTTEYSWLGKLTLSGSYVFTRVFRPRSARKKKHTPIASFLSGKTNELDTRKALYDGLHPTDLYIDKFWSMYWRFCKPMTGNPINEPPRPQNIPFSHGPQEFRGPGPQEFMGPGPQEFMGPGPQEFMGPGPQEFMGPGPQNFMGPGPQEFMGPGPQNFMGPGPQEFMGPGPQNFMGPGPQEFMGPGPQNFMGPGPQDVMGPPGPQGFGGPGPQDYMGPGPQNFAPSGPPGPMAPFPQPTPNEPGFFPDRLAAQNSEERLEQERERQRLAAKEKLLKEEEKMRKKEARELQERERRQKEEAEKLKREQEKLRLEREAVERQKQELLRLEREQHRLERERLEREKEELKKIQMKYDEARRGLKRPLPSGDRDHGDFLDDNRKKVPDMIGPDRRGPNRGTDLPSSRGMGDRAFNRGGEMGSMIRESDRSVSARMPNPGFNRPAAAAARGSQKAPIQQGRRWQEDIDRGPRSERPGTDRSPLLRAPNQFGNERARDNLRSDDRTLPRNMGQGQRSSFMPSNSEQNQRDAPYSGGSVSGSSMGAWRKEENTSVASKNGSSNFNMNSSTMMGRYIPNSRMNSSNNMLSSGMNSGNMMGGNMSNSSMNSSDMMGRNMPNTMMNSGNMMGGNTSNSNMTGRNMPNTGMSSGNMRGGNMSNSSMNSSNMMGRNIPNTGMNSGNMRGGNMSNSSMNSSNMMGRNMPNTGMNSGNMKGGGNMSNSSMNSSNMTGRNMPNTGMNSGNMRGGNMFDSMSSTGMMDMVNMSEFNMSGGRGMDDNQGNWMNSNRSFNTRWDNNTAGRDGGAMNMMDESYNFGSRQVPGNQTQFMSNANPGDRFRAMANYRK